MEKTKLYVNENFSCRINIELEEKDSFLLLSICGEMFDSFGQNIGFGQIHEEVKEILPARLYQIWKRWHLNDMRAGTFTQEEILRQAKDSGVELDSYYEQCDYLAKFDALIDDGYKYGSKWLKEELPQDVIDYIQTL